MTVDCRAYQTDSPHIRPRVPSLAELVSRNPRSPSVSPKEIKLVRDPRYLIADPFMTAAAICQGATESSLRHLPIGIFPALTKKVQGVDGPDGNAGVGPILAAPVHEGSALATESSRIALCAIVLLEGIDRGSPGEIRDGNLVVHVEERRGALAALGALARSTLCGVSVPSSATA